MAKGRRAQTRNERVRVQESASEHRPNNRRGATVADSWSPGISEPGTHNDPNQADDSDQAEETRRALEAMRRAGRANGEDPED